MDFANKRIGGAVFTHGLALEEKLAMEFTDFVITFNKSAYFLNLTKTDVRPCIFIHKHPVRQV